MRLKARLLLLTLLCLPAWGVADIQKLDTNTSLRTVYLLPDADAELVSVAMIVLAGEVDWEGPEGLSHYLEHLVFWHADNVRGESIHSREGNAWVNGLITTYFNRGEISQLEDMIKFARRVLDPPGIARAFMLGERDVVSREYDLRVLENPEWRVFTDLRRQLYDNHPVSRSVIGTPDSINALTLQHAFEFHGRFYHPENSILLISGNISATRLKSLIESGFSDYSDQSPDKSNLHLQDWRNTRVAGTLDSSTEYKEKQAKSSRLIYGSLSNWQSEFGIVQSQYVFQFAQRLLESALPGSIAKPLRLDNFVISSYELSVGRLLNDQAELNLIAWPDNGVSLEEASDKIRWAIKKTGDEGVPQKSFDRIKKRWIQTATRESSSSDTLMWRAWHHISHGLEPNSQEDHLRRIEAVTLTELNSLMRALGDPQRRVVGYINGE